MANEKHRINAVTLENVRIMFRNFSGKEGQYNAKGKRNFCVFLDDDIGNAMSDDGWNVNWLTAREEDEARQAYIQVAVSYANRPPRIVMITSRGKTPLDEDTIDLLDWAEIQKTDVILNPYVWDVNGKSGVKAYAKSVFVTLIEDELEKKYLDVPDSAASALPAQPDFDDN